ncbi:hypothetical protein [Piscirickettsia salmonis]|nr:hypothetical protein [Piscirickettsia salmonis]
MKLLKKSVIPDTPLEANDASCAVEILFFTQSLKNADHVAVTLP